MLLQQPDESKETTAERSKSASNTCPILSSNEGNPDIISRNSVSCQDIKSKKSSQEIDRIKLELNPPSATLDDYVKVVKKRVINRKKKRKQ